MAVLTAVVPLVVACVASRHGCRVTLTNSFIACLTSIQHALCTPNLTLPLLHHGCRMPDSDCKRLEGTLCPVVIVVTAYAVNVEGGARRLRKALEAVRDHLAAQIANLFPLKTQLNDAIWPVRQVDDSP